MGIGINRMALSKGVPTYPGAPWKAYVARRSTPDHLRARDPATTTRTPEQGWEPNLKFCDFARVRKGEASRNMKRGWRRGGWECWECGAAAVLIWRVCSGPTAVAHVRAPLFAKKCPALLAA